MPQVKALTPLPRGKGLPRELGAETAFGYRSVALSGAQLADCMPPPLTGS